MHLGTINEKNLASTCFHTLLNIGNDYQISDFLVGFCSVLGDGIHSAMHNEWYGGDFFCRLFRFISPLTLFASNYLLIGMSVDRFLAIKYPLNVVRIGMFSFHLISLLILSIHTYMYF
jgi:hypothetical protein